MKTSTSRRGNFHSGILAFGMSAVLASCGGQDGASQSGSVQKAESLQVARISVAPPSTYTVRNLPPGFTLSNSYAHALNDNGQVCGAWIFPDTTSRHAAVFDGDQTKDIGVLGDTHLSQATAINAQGWVAGYSFDSNRIKHLLFNDGVISRDLGAKGTDGLTPAAINGKGQVAGILQRSGQLHPFLYSDGTLSDLGNSGLSTDRSPDLNEQGQLAGTYFTTGNVTRGFVYADGQVTDIGALDGASSSVAVAINAFGQIVGESFNGTVLHAFRYESGKMVDLGALNDNANSSRAVAINRNGEVSGVSETGFGTFHAFFHDGSTMRDLGTLGVSDSYANAMNANGHVVGSFTTSNGTQHAFIWSSAEGKMVDLNDRITNAPNLVINVALAISDSGFILAGSSTGWVLLRPDAPPSSPPTLGPIIADDPIPTGSPVNASVQFTDIDANDTHTAAWTWDASGSTPAASLTEPIGATAGSTSASHVYTTSGVYNISVTVTDSAGKSSSVGGQVVVYDPNGGFVAGGGWINSPIGAYKADPTLGGRATFGFTSKYLKGATKPSGQTEFQFQSANLNFHSSDYDWLVVGGARAQYKGTGTINGSGSYKFMLTAVDGDLIGKGTPDRFRMRIWHYDEASKTDVVDYDNQIDSSTEGSNLEGTAIGGGSISIKTK